MHSAKKGGRKGVKNRSNAETKLPSKAVGNVVADKAKNFAPQGKKKIR